MLSKVSYYENSKEIEKKIWNLLTQAVKDRSSDFRTPVFICGNDKDIDGRIVVLRKADQQNNLIQYHSDIRSSKIEKIKKNPKCSILFYSKEEKIQLRVKVNCLVNHDNEITEQSWSKTAHISRKCYLVKNGPGTETDEPSSGLSEDIEKSGFTMEQSEEGYKNFTVIQCNIESIEWLYLAAKGHRRARFDITNNKQNWLIP